MSRKRTKGTRVAVLVRKIGRAFLRGRLSVNYELIGILPGFGRPNRFGT